MSRGATAKHKRTALLVCRQYLAVSMQLAAHQTASSPSSSSAEASSSAELPSALRRVPVLFTENLIHLLSMALASKSKQPKLKPIALEVVSWA